MFKGGKSLSNCCANTRPAVQLPPSSTQARGICATVNPNCSRIRAANSSSNATVKARHSTISSSPAAYRQSAGVASRRRITPASRNSHSYDIRAGRSGRPVRRPEYRPTERAPAVNRSATARVCETASSRRLRCLLCYYGQRDVASSHPALRFQ